MRTCRVLVCVIVCLAGAAPPDSQTRPSRAAAGTRDATVSKLNADEFFAHDVTGFPPAQNLARGGTVRASSTHAQMEDPLVVVGGVRRRDVWAFNQDHGILELAWPKPVEARYVLLFNRPGGFGDHWQAATVHVNGRRVAKLDEFRTGQVIVLDLGEVVPVRSMALNVKGIARPGLAGLELHRRVLPTARK